MLLSAEEIRIGGASEDRVIEYSIHLAAEALLFAFCAEVPKVSMYRPLDPFRLQENARLLRMIIYQSSSQDTRLESTTRYTAWDFRKRALEALVPGAPRIRSA